MSTPTYLELLATFGAGTAVMFLGYLSSYVAYLYRWRSFSGATVKEGLMVIGLSWLIAWLYCRYYAQHAHAWGNAFEPLCLFLAASGFAISVGSAGGLLILWLLGA